MNNRVTGKIVRKVLGSFIFLFLSFFAHATHQVGGYIAYKCLGGNTIQVTIISYTNTYLTTVDRDTMRIYWGDGSNELLYRQNGPIDDNNYPNGVPICNYQFDATPPTPLVDARKINIYVGTHTYDGPGDYTLWMDDPDRMANIDNITGSVNVDYYMYTTICANAFLIPGCVNSPLITNSPVCQYGCAGECYTYNPGAYIPTPPSDVNDSIVYSLGHSLFLNTSTKRGETCPGNDPVVPSGTIKVDAITGTLSWCNAIAGKWNFVILMTTVRRNYISVGGQLEKQIVPIDTVELELEVIINGNCDYNPTVTSIDTCVIAGDTFNHKFKATGSPSSEPLYITYAGEPLSLSPPATITGTSSHGDPVFPVINWATNCPEVRANPYIFVLRATEKALGSGFPPDTNYYSGYGTALITVVGPPPPNLVETITGTTVCLSWGQSPCPQATGYNIYRKIGCTPWIHDGCTTGVPPSSGYTLIATNVGITNTTYCDSNGGAGLSPGVDYSYIVDATYPLESASQSIASNSVCALIKLSVPVLTNVSVTTTDLSKGEMFLRWMRPIADTLNLDTTKFPPPYKTVLSHATGMNSKLFSQIASFTYPKFTAIPQYATYSDTGLNTALDSYNYKIDFSYTDPLSHGFKLVGSSGTASSTYLRTQRGDKQVTLGWSAKVPWTNDTNYVYRSVSGPYSFIGKTIGTTYIDTELHNGTQYCYYVKTENHYADTNIMHPLFDSSETICATPQDTIAPCAPPLTVNVKCTLYVDSLVWSNPDRLCPRANKVTSYQVWYTPVENGDMAPIATINNPEDTIFVIANLASVAGCYAVYAFDSAGQAIPLNTVCVDNCPQYTLPNVFTPNGDGTNDFFTPLEPYRYIKDVDINIYNRWGQLMFHTTNPNINWNGTDEHSGQPCPDGVYYYICTVNEIRLKGIVPVVLKGFIEIIRGK